MKMFSRLTDHAAVVEAVLEGFVLACVVLIESGVVPPYPHDAGVRYQMEPVGEEDWKLPTDVIREGWGDCEDLSFWTAAGHRVTGTDPGAHVRIMRIGPGKLHAIVMRSDGSIDDPSLDLCPAGGARGCR
jgi:hypothetical protein